MTVRIPRSVVVLVLAILLVGGAGVGSFLLGRSTGRNSIDQRAIRTSAYNNGYGVGYLAGNQSGLIQGRSQGRQSAYTNGYNAAVRKANGKIAGTLNAGQNLAFAGYNGWDIGHYYVVQIGAGTGGTQYAIPTRIELTPGQAYDLCPTSNGICTGPIP